MDGTKKSQTSGTSSQLLHKMSWSKNSKTSKIEPYGTNNPVLELRNYRIEGTHLG